MNKQRAYVVGLVFMIATFPSMTYAQAAHYDLPNVGSDASCGGLYNSPVQNVRGIVFHCQEDLVVKNGRDGGTDGDRSDHFGLPGEAFCGMRRFGDTPGRESYFEAMYDQQFNKVHFEGLARGQGAKIWQHIASRWIVIGKSDPKAVKSFVCTGGDWRRKAIGVGRGVTPDHPNESLCFTMTVRDDGDGTPGLGPCS